MRVVKRRKAAFVVLMLATAISLLASAQQPKKPPAAPAAKPGAAPGKKPPSKPVADASVEPGSDAGPLAAKEERPTGVASKDAGSGGGVVEAKTLDGGTRSMKFGEVDVEVRLKSPQLVYFLRRVRAEFAAGDLGHRSFNRELSETRNDPGF
jgi:hypothetical protein